MVGDSAGSLYEFVERMVTEEELEESMNMPGGGPWGVGEGQFTDDSEMAFCLMYGLNGNVKKDKVLNIDANLIAE